MQQYRCSQIRLNGKSCLFDIHGGLIPYNKITTAFNTPFLPSCFNFGKRSSVFPGYQKCFSQFRVMTGFYFSVLWCLGLFVF